jgi:hypothetical protein
VAGERRLGCTGLVGSVPQSVRHDAARRGPGRGSVSRSSDRAAASR